MNRISSNQYFLLSRPPCKADIILPDQIGQNTFQIRSLKFCHVEGPWSLPSGMKHPLLLRDSASSTILAFRFRRPLRPGFLSMPRDRMRIPEDSYGAFDEMVEGPGFCSHFMITRFYCYWKLPRVVFKMDGHTNLLSQ